MKRVMALLCALVLLSLCTVTATAGTTQQVVLTTFDGALMLTAKEEPAVWETPTLLAGEALRESGSLVLSNQTDAAHTVTLDYVELPFDNEQALTYLNHLNITVREGDIVLYDGAYSRINDEGGLALSYKLEADESVTLAVDLRCDYTFTGNTGFEDGAIIDWKFFTVVQNEVASEDRPAAAFSDPALREVLIAVGAAVLLLAGVGVYEIVRRRRM